MTEGKTLSKVNQIHPLKVQQHRVESILVSQTFFFFFLGEKNFCRPYLINWFFTIKAVFLWWTPVACSWWMNHAAITGVAQYTPTPSPAGSKFILLDAHTHTHTEVINASPSGSHQSRQEWIAKGTGHKINKAPFYSSERQTMSRCSATTVTGQKAAWQPGQDLTHEGNSLQSADLLSICTH